ncbi:MAG: hypothetical protein ACK5O7_04415 [Holosporales bacterium]
MKSRALLLSSCIMLAASQLAAVPEATVPMVSARANDAKDIPTKIQQALQKKPLEAGSVWDPEIFKTFPMLLDALTAYEKGQRGQQAKTIKVANRTANEIREDLKKNGFKSQKVPLVAGKGFGRITYWKKDGTRTIDRRDPDIIQMEIYYHDDGSIIRIKEQGVPHRNHPSKGPHVVKAVMLDLSKKPGKEGEPAAPDTRARNEAFKLTDDGIPVPRSPGPNGGLRRLYDRADMEADPHKAETQRNWKNEVMKLVHIPLKIKDAQ